MCSIYDNEDGQSANFLETEKIEEISTFNCRKCTANPAAIKLRVNDFYCASCFQIIATHKFRATLGKSKIVKPTDEILVAHSGSTSSTALLHLINAGMQLSVHKRLVFKVKVIFIDDGMLKNQTPEERREICTKIADQLRKIGFDCFVVSLNDALSVKFSSKMTEIVGEGNEKVEEEISSEICAIDKYVINLTETTAINEKLVKIFNQLPSNSSKIDFVKKLRYQMLIESAKILNCNKIFTANTSSSLAIDILTNVSLGRGSQLSSDVSFIDDRDRNILILRPMKDFAQHEVEFYVKMHQIPTINGGQVLEGASNDAYSSIQQLTSKFVNDLEEKFSGSVSTIFRTGEKLTSVGAENNGGVHKSDDDNCVFCNGLLDSSHLQEGICAVDATEFSKLMSSMVSKNFDAKSFDKLDSALHSLNFDRFKNGFYLDSSGVVDENVCTAEKNFCDSDNINENVDGCCANLTNQNQHKIGTFFEGDEDKDRNGVCCRKNNEFRDDLLTIESVRKCLCYGCRLIFQCIFDVKSVPEFVLKKCQRRLCLEEMRQQLTEFLL